MKYLFVVVTCLICLSALPNVSGLPPSVLEQVKKINPSLLEKPRSQRKSNELLKLVHKLSNAKKVSLDTNSRSLNFDIQTKPIVQKVIIEGPLSAAEKERILRLSQINEGDTIQKQLLENAAIAVKQSYMREGFFSAEVSVETKKISESKSNVVIMVKPNEPAKINTIKVQSTNQNLNKDLGRSLSSFEDEELSLSALDSIRENANRYLIENRYLQAVLLEPRYQLREEKNGAADIILEVQRPQRYELSFYGNDQLSKNKILRELDLEKQSKRFGVDIKTALQQRVRDIYIKQAYPKTQVKIDELPGDGFKILRINIKEGKRVKIFKWNMRGQYARNSQYYIDKIAELGSAQISNERFVESELKEALENLNVSLQNQGYLNSSAELERVSWINDSTVEVFIYLDEGVLTILEEVIFKNAKAFSRQELLEVIDLKEQGPLNLNKIESSLENLRAHYLKHAYLDFEVKRKNTELIKYFDQNKRAKLIFDISEGNEIIVQNIIISGTIMTQESVVRKSLAFKAGDSLTLDRIKDSESQLQRLGIFSKVDIRPLPANSGNRPVLVKISERKPGIFTFGPGISDELGGTVRAFTGVIYKNLGGSAKVVQGRVEIKKNLDNDSFLENRITLSYLEPFLFGKRLRGKTNFSFSQDIDFLSSENTTNTYIRETKEVNFALEKDIDRHLKLGWNLWGISGTRRFEIDRNDDQEKLQVASIGPYLDLDYRDHPFTPRQGTYTRFNLEYASPRLASSKDIHFIRATGAFNHYVPLDDDRYFVLAYSLRGGYVENVGEPGALSIPQDEMFFLGGRATLRGFDLSELPRDSDITSLKPAGSSIYYITDKTYFGLIKVELRFPLYKDFGAALFYDGGVVEIPEVEIADTYRHSAGIGFRWYTPVGPVSLEYGLKLDKKTGENDGRIHFSIGAF